MWVVIVESTEYPHDYVRRFEVQAFDWVAATTLAARELHDGEQVRDIREVSDGVAI